jgi:hypothetical protein
MATKTIIVKQHDTKITFTDTPTIDNVPVLPADLSGCTVSFLLKDSTIPKAIKQLAVINVDGTFSYDPVPADVADIGKFSQEWEVLYPTGKILTFPNNGYNIVKIIADLG